MSETMDMYNSHLGKLVATDAETSADEYAMMARSQENVDKHQFNYHADMQQYYAWKAREGRLVLLDIYKDREVEFQ